MKKTVKVSKVETMKAGKVDRLVLHYEVLDGPKAGEVWKIGALAVKLDEPSRNLLKSAKAGDMLDIEITKDGNYWNLTSVATAGSVSAPRPSMAPIRDNRQESIVFQNAMAHATAISIHNAGSSKVKLADVIAMAHDIAKVSIDPSKDVVETDNENMAKTLQPSDDDFGF